MENEPGHQANGLPEAKEERKRILELEKTSIIQNSQEKLTKKPTGSVSEDEYDPESLTVHDNHPNHGSNVAVNGQNTQNNVEPNEMDSDYDPEDSLPSRPVVAAGGPLSSLPAKPQSGKWVGRNDAEIANPGVRQGDGGHGDNGIFNGLNGLNGPNFQQTLAAVIRDVGSNPSFSSLSQEQQARIITAELSKRGATTNNPMGPNGPNGPTNYRPYEPNNINYGPRNGYGRPEFSVPMTPEERAKYEEFLNKEALVIRLPLWDKLPEHLRLFVGNLPLKFVTKEELFRVFSKYGNLLEILIRQGYGFVQYDSDEAVQKCIKGETGIPLHNRVLRFDPTRPFKRRNPAQDVGFTNGMDNQMESHHGKREHSAIQTVERTVAREREQTDNVGASSTTVEEDVNEEQREEGPAKKRQKVEEAECVIYITAKSSSNLTKIVQKAFSNSKVLQFEVEDISDGDLQESMSDAAYSGAVGTCIIKEDTVDVLTFEQTDDGGVKFDEYADVDPATAVEILEQFALGDEEDDKEEVEEDDEEEAEEDDEEKVAGDDYDGLDKTERNFIDNVEKTEKGGTQESRAGSEEYVPTYNAPEEACTTNSGDLPKIPQPNLKYQQTQQSQTSPQHQNQQVSDHARQYVGYDNQQYQNQRYGNHGYDNQGYNNQKFNNQGYQNHYNNQGYQNPGHSNQRNQNQGYNNQGYNNQGYNNQGYNNQGYNNRGYNNQGYSNQGFNNQGFNNQVFNNQVFNNPGFNNLGMQNQEIQNQGFNNQGFNNQGFNHGLQNQGFPNQPTGLSSPGFNQFQQNQFQGQQPQFQGPPNLSHYNNPSPNQSNHPQISTQNIPQNVPKMPSAQVKSQDLGLTSGLNPIQKPGLTPPAKVSKVPTEVQRIRGERQRLLGYEKYTSKERHASEDQNGESNQSQQHNNSMYTGTEATQKAYQQQPVIPTGPAAYNQALYTGQNSSSSRQFQQSGALAQAQNLLQTLQDSQSSSEQDQSKELKDMLARLSGLG